MITYKYDTAFTSPQLFQKIVSQQATAEPELMTFTKRVLEHIIDTYDNSNILVGLLCYARGHTISPFRATRDFCVKVLSTDHNDCVLLNISPVYHLGPEYPEYHKQKEGTDLSREAIIGLIETRSTKQDEEEEDHTRFSLGIDAGIAFKNARIPHNKSLSLYLSPAENGIIANLHCEGQATAKEFSWKALNIQLGGKTKDTQTA